MVRKETDFRKRVRNRICEWAPTHKVDRYPDETKRLMRLIGKLSEWDGETYLVTDESLLGDFLGSFGKPDPDELAELGSALGFAVAEDDLICDIAAKMARN